MLILVFIIHFSLKIAKKDLHTPGCPLKRLRASARQKESEQ